MSDHDQRSTLKQSLIIAVISIGAVLILILTDFGNQSHRVKVYDCGIAEWHPDIPKQVKEECRRLHYEEQQEYERQKKIIRT